MSTPPTNPQTADDTLAQAPKQDRQATRAARLNVGAGIARRSADAAATRDDTASASFVIIAERVDVTNNFNFG
ncbi:p8 [Cocksfoot mild mosaic virus]|uniref:p8 n=1 Tax=Cocksfoot mild mosaic virus TaxID=479060 RepID=B4XRZ7_9TOMB|nr:p8 [Cocksfoot mild mosaic virus]ABW74551.1 p8 [Cocksfoot mild mosaic virus]